MEYDDVLDPMEEEEDISEVLENDEVYQALLRLQYNDIASFYRHFKKLYRDTQNDSQEAKDAKFVVQTISSLIKSDQSKEQIYKFFDVMYTSHPIGGKTLIQISKRKEDIVLEPKKKSKKQVKVELKRQTRLDYIANMSKIFNLSSIQNQKNDVRERNILKASRLESLKYSSVKVDLGCYLANKDLMSDREHMDNYTDTYNYYKNTHTDNITLMSYTENQKLQAPSLDLMRQMSLSVQFRNDADSLVAQILDLDSQCIFSQTFKPNDAGITEFYTRSIAELFSKQKWIRSYLFQGNEEIGIVEGLLAGEEDEERFKKQEDFIRFIVLGAPVLNSPNNTITSENIRVQHEFMNYFNYVNVIGGGYSIRFTDALTYFKYFLDGYIKSDEVFEYSKMLSKRMRQKYLYENYRLGQVADQTRPLVGMIDQTYAYQHEPSADLAETYFTRYLPLRKIITVSDLMRVNGVKTTVYHRIIQLFLHLSYKLRESPPFTYNFDFFVKQRRGLIIPEIIDTVVNPNPFPLIAKILSIVKEMLIKDVDQYDPEWIKSFSRELIFSQYNGIQDVVSCQSIGRLYSYQINSSVGSEAIVMVQSLLFKVLDTPDKVQLYHVFKLGWSFLQGRHEYLPIFQSVVSILPDDITSFLKGLYTSLQEYQYVPSLKTIQNLYANVLTHHISTMQFEQYKRTNPTQGRVGRRALDTKEYLYRYEQINPKSLYFAKAYDIITKYSQEQIQQIRNFGSFMASYIIAGIMLDTLVISIQDSLNDRIEKISIKTKASDKQPEYYDSEVHKAACLSYVSVVAVQSKPIESDIPFITFNSMENMPHDLWQKYCDVRYQAYDIVAFKYNINCLLMLIWFSSTRQYFYAREDEMHIYTEFSAWLNYPQNLDLALKIDKVSASRRNSTNLNTTLKNYLNQYNVHVIHLSQQQYTQNTNAEAYKLYKLDKLDVNKVYFIVGIYYNHIFMANNIDPPNLPNVYYSNHFLQFLTPKLKKVNYPSLMYIFAFDFETTQIKMKKKSPNKHYHDMQPYMLSWMFFQLQCNKADNPGMNIWVQETQTIDDGEDFIDQVYRIWLDKIVQLNSDVYFLSYNGSKFDIQFLYKSFVKYHSGSIQFFGSLLSPKYISIEFNKKSIFFIDLLLVLGGGKLNDWAKLMDLKPKEEFHPIYSLEMWRQSKIKDKIKQYCEHDVKLVALIYQKQCEQMLDMMRRLKINFNDDAIAVLSPTLASTAFNLFKNGYTLAPLMYIPYAEEDIERYVRMAYKGGFCHCYRVGRVIGDLHYFDINSLYPSIMMESFPTTPPSYVKYNITEKDRLAPLLTTYQNAHWHISSYEYYKGTKFCFIPQKIGNMGFYFRKGYDLEQTFVPSCILQLILPQLKVIHVCGALIYGRRPDHKDVPIFRNYIDKMYKLRLESKAQGDILSDKRIKALMNALYGKLAQLQRLKGDIIAAEYNGLFETNGSCDFDYNEYLDAFIMKNPNSSNNSLSYLAMEIAARSRAFLFKHMLQNESSVLYCDTDSLILNDKPRNMIINSTELGSWKDVYAKPLKIDEINIYCPKVYEIMYSDSQGQYSDIKIKGINKGYANFAENFEYLQNNLESHFGEQIVWQRKLGFIRQNATSKKIQYRVRRYVNSDGSTEPFEDYDQYMKYYSMVLTMEDEKFVFKERRDLPAIVKPMLLKVETESEEESE